MNRVKPVAKVCLAYPYIRGQNFSRYRIADRLKTSLSTEGSEFSTGETLCLTYKLFEDIEARACLKTREMNLQDRRTTNGRGTSIT